MSRLRRLWLGLAAPFAVFLANGAALVTLAYAATR